MMAPKQRIGAGYDVTLVEESSITKFIDSFAHFGSGRASRRRWSARLGFAKANQESNTMDCPEASPSITLERQQTKIHKQKPETLVKEKSKERYTYSVFVAEHPFLLFFSTFFVIFICALCSFVPAFNAPEFPDFSTPVMGFEARGSQINGRWRTRLFLSIAIGRKMFSPIPPMRAVKDTTVMQSAIENCPNINLTIIRSRVTRELQSVPHKKGSRTRRDHSYGNAALQMCDSPNVYMKSRIHYKTIYATSDGEDLMTAKNLRAVCRLEKKIMKNFAGYERKCYKRNITRSWVTKEECCPSWSIGNYVAAIRGKASCDDIDSADVLHMTKRLQKCSDVFNNESLKENCWNFDNGMAYPYCEGIPVDCVQYNAVFNILYYLSDKDFFGSQGGEHLKYSQVLTPRHEEHRFSRKIYYKYIEGGKKVEDGAVQLVATDFQSFKFNMFNTQLIADLVYPSIALMVILIIMWFYTESLLLTILLSVSVVGALILAYFVYMVILGLDFFPFLNVTTLIFLVGIGADDAFVYTDVWRQSKRQHPEASLTEITSYTLKHASLSMFVTSLTTAAAFIANFSSEITTIKLFGLYAGVAILAKFSLMVTWFPAVCVIHERYCVKNLCGSSSEKNTGQGWLSRCRSSYENIFTRFSRYMFHELLPELVISCRLFWIGLFSCMSAGGLFVLIGFPGFQFPTSSDFQMFASSHPLETYDLYLKDKFRFEISPSQESATFPIDIFWGIQPDDHGDQLNPYSYGKFGWDQDFDIISPESQKWLLDFCKRLRSQDFYTKKAGSEKKCFIEVYYNQTCNDPLVPELCYYPCCKNSTFPYSKDVLNFCAIVNAYRRKILRFKVQDSTIGSLIYDPQGNLKGIWLRIRSNVRLSRAYQPAHRFWKRIETWVRQEMKTAPPGMNKGWFTSDLEFYNLQQSLSRGTLLSLSIAIATTFGVMLLTTMNVFVSLYAILTIIGIISVTIGSLVLSGWKLNILESITMSVAVGVSIDFSMHFGVAYCLAFDKQSRTSRVRYSLSRMGSAISMAAVTTFLAGAFMMPSDVLSYIQMGHFLMLVMTVSWFFSVFFFQSLCAVAGPQGDTGQLSFKKIKKWLKLAPNDSEKMKKKSICEEKNEVVENEKEINQEDIEMESSSLVGKSD